MKRGKRGMRGRIKGERRMGKSVGVFVFFFLYGGE